MVKSRTILSIFALLAVLLLPTAAIEAKRQAQVLEPSTAVNLTAKTNPGDSAYRQDLPAVFKPGTSCHFGVAVVNNSSIPFTGYDLSTLGIGNYLDWAKTRNPSVPSNIDYYRVLNVSDAAYPTILSQAATLAANNIGATWLIGNEPDSEVTYQDHISAETYADRYFALATIIRAADPSAKIGFGTVIQPTPIRLYYLTKAMTRLAADAGGDPQAHALIDVYSIHSFILNEQPLYDSQGNNINWGAGVPVGYVAATWPAPEVIDIGAGETYKTYDITIFEQRVNAFRSWMKAQGEQNKPLWITEYGSLFPSAGNIYLQVSDADTANYMVQTFDYMLGTKDPNLGYADDAYRLVQKWDWYSLNQELDTFGGSYFNPNNHMLTAVGDVFLKYNPSFTAVPVVDPDVYVQANTLSITPFSPSDTPGLVNYKFSLKFSNYFIGDRSTGVNIQIYDGSTLIYSTQANMPRCGGSVEAAFLLKNSLPGSAHTFTATISLITGNGTDTNLANNTVTFPSTGLPTPTTYPAPSAYFPVVRK